MKVKSWLDTAAKAFIGVDVMRVFHGNRRVGFVVCAFFVTLLDLFLSTSNTLGQKG